MEGVPSGPVEEEYPVIERGVKIQWNTSAHTDGMSHADSVTNVAVVDTHANTPDGRRTVTIDDLYESMNFQPYRILR
jgi:hypothetical protein